MNLSEFENSRFNITGFSIVNYEKQNVINQIIKTVQTNASVNKVQQIPVKNISSNIFQIINCIFHRPFN